MAQTVSTVPAPLAVQRLAPQLVTFAGSEANFQSLVNGLAAGTPVQLVTTLSNGFTQSVTFTPAATSSPAQIAQILEAARQQLIGLGIGAPTGEQIGFTLMGGLVPTPLGGTQVSGLATPNPPSRAAQIQQQAAAGATAPATPPATAPVTSAVNVQTTPTATTATVSAPRQTSDSLVAPGTTSRSPAPISSASPAFNTSASPQVNTSATPFAPAAQAPGTGSTPPTQRPPASARAPRN